MFRKILPMEKILCAVITAVVFITFVNALVFFGIGIFYRVENYWTPIGGDTEGHRPGLAMLESLDPYFVGFSFIIFSIGMNRLFLASSLTEYHHV